jgi:hypothetical protein
MPTNGWPGKDSMNTGLAGSFELENGETAWVVYRQIEAPKWKDLRIPAEPFASRELKDDNKLTIALIDKSDDSSRFIIEVPLEIAEVRRALRELAERKPLPQKPDS